MSDVSYMGPLQGITAGPKDRFARCLAMVHAAVPCKAELVGSKSTAVPITIIRFLDTGFSSAPYVPQKKGSAVPAANQVKTEPLFRMDTSKITPELEVWSYVSKGTSRGPRESGVFIEGGEVNPPLCTLKTGLTFVFFVNELTFQSASAQGVLPADTDWIPAMSMVELWIAPRHIDSCTNGRSINVKSLRMSTMEMDAVFQRGIDAAGMPSSVDEACKMAVAHRERYPSLMKDVEVEKAALVVSGNNLIGAYMGELPDVDSSNGDDGVQVSEFVKMIVSGSTAFSGSEYVDIPIHALQKQTNCKSNEHAVALLDIALSAGAVNLFCVTDQRWANKGTNSMYRAIPVIDTTILFGALDKIRSVGSDYAMVAKVVNGSILLDDSGVEVLEKIDLINDPSDTDSGDGNTLVLPTGFSFDDGLLDLVIRVDSEDLHKTHSEYTHYQKNAALALVGPGVLSSKGYHFQFDVRCNDSNNDISRVFHGYVNRSSCAGGTAGMVARKRKAISMD